MNSPTNLLTEYEVATILRSTIRKVQRLRREGALPYIPGRPVLIMAGDLEDYLVKQRTAAMSVAAGPYTVAQLDATKQAECDAAAARARRTFKLRRAVTTAKVQR